MKERGRGGAIVNVSSVLSDKLDMALKSMYGVTKAAVQKLTTATAFELGKYKVHEHTSFSARLRRSCCNEFSVLTM